MQGWVAPCVCYYHIPVNAVSEVIFRNAELFTGERFLGPHDLRIAGGVIVDIIHTDLLKPKGVREVDLTGMWVLPALCDLHTHLREPGNPEKETIATGLAAAAMGGYGLVVAMPNTNPVCDTPEICEAQCELRRQAMSAQANGELPRLKPACALTVGRKGEQPVEFEPLLAVGCTLFTDDGDDVEDDEVLRSVFRTLGTAQLPEDTLVRVMFHAQNRRLMRHGVMHDGDVSWRMKLPGISRESEDVAVKRAINFGLEFHRAVHITHVTTAGAVQAIRKGKEEYERANLEHYLTCEVTPHHLTFTHEDVERLGAVAKVNPPLREENDRHELRKGLLDGTIDIVATDHAPHTAEEKAQPLANAPFGITGLEVALAASMTATGAHRDQDRATRVLSAMTSVPAGFACAPPYCGLLRERDPADLVVFDPGAEWVVNPQEFAGKCKVSPYAGMKLKGRVRLTMLGGSVAYGSLDELERVR